jgi:hypothetical protein
LQDAKVRTLSTHKGQDGRIKMLSTNKEHEKVIFYRRRKLTNMQLKDLPEVN